MATWTVAGAGTRKKMMASLMWLLVSALWVGDAAAQGSPPNTASTYSMDDVPDWQTNSAMSLQITAPGANIVPLTYTVVPLTSSLGLNQSQLTRGTIYIRGNLVSATQTSYVNINSSNSIAYLCCDASNTSFIDPNRMLNTLMQNRPRGILLYSQQGNCCGLRGTDLPYQTIFTMADAGEASETLSITNTVGDGIVQAAIMGNVTNSDSDPQDSQGGNSSAVAMSILYSITGLITLLFLVIIATGAIRAHRYPERYGPRGAEGGRTRQSRAKGLARAVLETLPIVKFGDPAPSKGDPSIELESASGRGGANDVQVHHLSTIPEDAEAQSQATSSTEKDARAGPDTAVTATSSHEDGEQIQQQQPPLQQEEEHLGCSICTEDFKVGEDVRVLPCNHKFHPPCIDPWLINVSGTCPLCRLDLRPGTTQEGQEGEETETSAATPDEPPHLPPPLETEAEADQEAAEASATAHRRRSSRLFDLNRLRHASVEERLEVLRRYRTENQEQEASPANPADHEDERRRSATLTQRLRDKFRIRTRTQSSSHSQPAEHDAEGSAA